MTLSIIILNYNTRDLLKQTIRSINTKIEHEIIVVDNNSSDGSVEMLRRRFPKVKLVSLDQNFGFAAGNNRGIDVAKGKYILILNSDTKVLGDALDQLVHYMDQHQEIGIISPKLVLTDGSIDMSCHRGFPTIANSIAYFAGLETLLPNFKPVSSYHQTWQDFQSIHQVEAISFAAAMIRRQVFEQIGQLDEQFFMYAEDIDFCKRAFDADWKIVYFPDAIVVHYKGASGTKNKNKSVKSKTRQHFYHTMKQYFRKHGKAPKVLQPVVDLGIDVVAKIKR